MTVVDPYLDPAIGELRNLLGAKSADELRALEPQAVFANELELANLSIRRSNDLSELCAIHAQLFKGVYEWAGTLRTVDIRKHRKDAQFFLPVAFIERASGIVFSELQADKGMRTLSHSAFVQRLAYFYDQLNYIHPFREGNGRAQRVFWQRVANDAGFSIDWTQVVGDENDEACIAAMEHSNRQPLVAMFQRIVHQL